jgi:hypothetical protein
MVQEGKEDIKAVSLEYDSNEYEKQKPVPCVFFEVDHEKNQLYIRDASLSIIERLAIYRKKEYSPITNLCKTLFDDEILIWQIGTMLSRTNGDKSIRIFTAPLEKDKRWAFIGKYAGIPSLNLMKDDLFYREIISSEDIEVLFDFDVDEKGCVSNISMNTFYKSYKMLIYRVRDLYNEGRISTKEWEFLRKWQRRILIQTEGTTIIALKHLAHFKTRIDKLYDDAIYLRIQLY